MNETPESQIRRFQMPYRLIWPAIGVCAVLVVALLITHTEQIQGQIADIPPSMLLIMALLAAAMLQNAAWCGRLIDFISKPRSLLLIAVVAFVVLAVGSYLVFGTQPLSSDEQTHLFQARLFAQFKLMANYPPQLIDRVVPAGYQNYFILVSRDGRAMSVYWPGWALLMTPFVWLGAPWLLGPTMASIGLYVMGRLATLLAGAQAAAVAVLLTVTSGAFIVTGMSLYPAGGYFTLNMLYALLLLRGGRRDTLLAGLVGGLALNLNNPVPHALFALPWLIWLAADPARRRRLLWLAAGYAPWLAVSLAWLVATSSLGASAGTTGNFWHDRLPLWINVPTLQIIGQRLWELVRLWMWSAPGLLVLAILGWRHQVRYSGAWILGVAFGLTVILYCLFPAGQGLGYGARYYQSAWGGLPILAAIYLLRPGTETLRRIALTAALFGLVLVVPFQILFARDLVQKGYPPLQALSTPGANLYFVDTSEYGDPSMTLNDPELKGQLVLASFGTASDQQLVDRMFPGARLLLRNSFGSAYARP
jgi:hypothetical protein